MKQKHLLTFFLILGIILSIIVCVLCAINTKSPWQQYYFFISIDNDPNVTARTLNNAIQLTISSVLSFLNAVAISVAVILYNKVPAKFFEKLEKRKSERLACKAEREENAKQQRIAKLQSELDELKKGGE